MPSAFPASLDDFTNPNSGHFLGTSVGGATHSGQHSNLNDAIEALQARVGVTGSVVTTTHDYKLALVTGTLQAFANRVSVTDRLLGRSTAGAGVVEEIVCTPFARSILDDAAALNVRATIAAVNIAGDNLTGTLNNSAAFVSSKQGGGSAAGFLYSAAGGGGYGWNDTSQVVDARVWDAIISGAGGLYFRATNDANSSSVIALLLNRNGSQTWGGTASPSADNSFDLGDSNRWRDGRFGRTLFVATSVCTPVVNANGAPSITLTGGVSLISDMLLRPGSDNALDFGTNALRWKDGYFSGVVYQAGASLAATYAALGHTHTFASLTSKPTTIGGYGITDYNSLGDARWLLLTGGTLTGTLTNSAAFVSSKSGGGTGAAFLASSASDPIGYGWSFTSGAAHAKHWDVVALTNEMRFRALDDALNATTWLSVARSGSTPTTVSFGADVLPLTDNTRNLGTLSLRWKDFYNIGFISNVGGIFASVDATDWTIKPVAHGPSIRFRPNSAAGGVANRYGNLGWVDNAGVWISTMLTWDESANAVFGGSVTPAADNNKALGTTALRWSEVVARALVARHSGNAEIYAVTTGSGNSRAVYFQDTAGLKFNWIAGAQINTDQAFEITPSTAAGGATYTAPAISIDSATGGDIRISRHLKPTGDLSFNLGTAALRFANLRIHTIHATSLIRSDFAGAGDSFVGNNGANNIQVHHPASGAVRIHGSGGIDLLRNAAGAADGGALSIYGALVLPSTSVGLITATTATTNAKTFWIANTGGDVYLGVESSVAGSFFASSAAYDAVLYSGGRILLRGTGVAVASGLFPTTDNVRDLGTSANRWKDLFLGGELRINSATQAAINFYVAGTHRWQFFNEATRMGFYDVTNARDVFVINANNIITCRSLIPETDGAFDIGGTSSTSRYRDLFMSRNVYVGSKLTVDGGTAADVSNAPLTFSNNRTLVWKDNAGLLTNCGFIWYDSSHIFNIGTINQTHFKLSSVGIYPNTDNAYSVGTASNRFNAAHFGGTVNAAAFVDSSIQGSFTVGGVNTSYYPVRFTQGATRQNNGGISVLNRFEIYRDDVHQNGTALGSFRIRVDAQPGGWGHRAPLVTRIEYTTGSGTTYNDPVGNVAAAVFSEDIIVWLKGAGTYQWRCLLPNSGAILADGNPTGVAKVGNSGETWAVLGSQQTVAIDSKNRTWVSPGLYVSGGATVTGYMAVTARLFSGLNTAAISDGSYVGLQYEAYSGDGSAVGYGFHRGGFSGLSLYHAGDSASLLRVRKWNGGDHAVFYAGFDSIPSLDAAYNLGSQTFQWTNVWARTLRVGVSTSTFATLSMDGTSLVTNYGITPSTDNGIDLGTSAMRWQDVWCMQVQASNYFSVVKDGSDTATGGAFIAVSNAAGSANWVTQLTASNHLDFFSGASGTYTKRVRFQTSGVVDFTQTPTVNGTPLSGTIGGSIANTQVAYGSGANTIQGSANFTYGSTGLYVSQAAASSGNPVLLNLVGGAHTSLSAMPEFNDVHVNLNRTVQFTGSMPTLAFGINVQPATYAATGASTINSAFTLSIAGAPQAGTNMTLTNTWSFAVRSGNSLFTGAVLSDHATSGMGYRVGAGGSGTQATSKATGVTLNNVCGTITLNGAALASATGVAFTFTNSAIAATDQLVVVHSSVGTLGGYGFGVTPAAGSATITVRNNTAGSLSEAIVLRFILIKATVS